MSATVAAAGIRAGRRDDGTLVLQLPEPPSANRWWRNVRGRMVVSRAAREYKSLIGTALTALRITPIPSSEPVSVSLIWYRGRRAGDLDKRVGVLLDALQGTAFENDSQITHLEARRRDVPRVCCVEVQVRVARGIGEPT